MMKDYKDKGTRQVNAIKISKWKKCFEKLPTLLMFGWVGVLVVIIINLMTSVQYL